MKEEELIKKLESVELPEIELQSHRRRLKMALLDTVCLKKRWEVGIMELAKSKLRGAEGAILSALLLCQGHLFGFVAGLQSGSLFDSPHGVKVAVPGRGGTVEDLPGRECYETEGVLLYHRCRIPLGIDWAGFSSCLC